MTCKCEYADECNGETAIFYPFQVGATCSTAPCKAPNQNVTAAAQRTWVGLTDEQRINISYKADGNECVAVELTEAKLKELNHG
jgi:hypothetical protein